MICVTVKVEDTIKRVTDAAEKAAFRNFGHAAASLTKDARSTIETAPGPSAPGTPAHTHHGTYLRRALRFAADKDGAVAGPVASLVGTSAEPHELGGSYRGEEYPERPFMQPALERAAPRFLDDWHGSIGE